jgi:cell division protein FtsW
MKSYSGLIKSVMLALMAFGVVMIYSAGARVDVEPETFAWLTNAPSKQAVFAAVAFLAMLPVSRLDYRWLGYRGRLLTWPGLYLLVVAIVLLAAVYVPGVGMEINGARRWVRFGPISFQPSEFAKYALVIFLAGLLSWRDYPRTHFFRGLMPLCIAAGVVCGLVGKEDLGTAVLIALVAGVMLIAGGVRILHVTLTVMPAAAAGFVYMTWVKPHRMERLAAFTNIWSGSEAAYHPLQSLIAIASGGWLGMGLGEGMQKYGYLPEDTSDFIFSIICEELGLPGAFLVISLVAALIWSGRQIFRQTGEPLGKLLCFGVTAMIGVQAVMNIAVATVSVPTKGIALPFVSAGGSGLIFSALALGLVCSVARCGSASPGLERAAEL